MFNSCLTHDEGLSKQAGPASVLERPAKVDCPEFGMAVNQVDLGNEPYSGQ